MPTPCRIVSAVGVIALLLGAQVLPALAGPPAPPTAVTVRDSLRGFRLVDPRTGEEMWRAGDDYENVTNLIVGSDGQAYASVVDADGAATAVYAMTPGLRAAAPIGSVPGRAAVAAVAPAGDMIHLLHFPPPTPDDLYPPPAGVHSQPLPAGEADRIPAAAPGRDAEGFGMLSPDGKRWYGFERASPDWNAPLELVAMAFWDDGSPTRESLRLPALSGYSSLLLAPDGETLYIVDYIAQVIQVVSASPLALLHVAGFGRYATKRPPCAAALAPRGDRLYVLGNAGSTNAGDGILAYETESWRVVGHVLPGRRDLYCLTVAPEGGTLYASTFAPVPAPDDPWLVTIDAATGQERASVPLHLDTPGISVGAVTSGGPYAEAPEEAAMTEG